MSFHVVAAAARKGQALSLQGERVRIRRRWAIEFGAAARRAGVGAPYRVRADSPGELAVIQIGLSPAIPQPGEGFGADQE